MFLCRRCCRRRRWRRRRRRRGGRPRRRGGRRRRKKKTIVSVLLRHVAIHFCRIINVIRRKRAGVLRVGKNPKGPHSIEGGFVGVPSNAILYYCQQGDSKHRADSQTY